jgi:transcriptional regulator with XRE-family HTH domain
MKTLSKRIKSLRISGETQAEFADRLGTTQASISRYLNGRQPDRETLIKIADRTRVSLDWLLTGKENGNDKKAASDTETTQTVISNIGSLKKLSTKEKTQMQALIRDLVSSKTKRKDIISYWEKAAKNK